MLGSRVVGGDVGQTWEQVRLKAVTTRQPWGAEETSHSSEDLPLKEAGVRAGGLCPDSVVMFLLSAASDLLWN